MHLSFAQRGSVDLGVSEVLAAFCTNPAIIQGNYDDRALSLWTKLNVISGLGAQHSHQTALQVCDAVFVQRCFNFAEHRSCFESPNTLWNIVEDQPENVEPCEIVCLDQSDAPLLWSSYGNDQRGSV